MSWTIPLRSESALEEPVGSGGGAEDLRLLAGGQVPDTDGAVPVSGEERSAVRGEAQGMHRRSGAPEGPWRAGERGGPHPEQSPAVPGGGPAAVRGQGRSHLFEETVWGRHLLAGRQVKTADDAVRA